MSDLQHLLKNLVETKNDPTQLKADAIKASVQVNVTESYAGKNGIERVEKEIRNDRIEVEKKTIVGKPMYVSVEYGANKNLGNFNMAKIKVSVSSPVGVEFTSELISEVEKSIENCRKIAEKFVAQELRELG